MLQDVASGIDGSTRPPIPPVAVAIHVSATGCAKRETRRLLIRGSDSVEAELMGALLLPLVVGRATSPRVEMGWTPSPREVEGRVEIHPVIPLSPRPDVRINGGPEISIVGVANRDTGRLLQDTRLLAGVTRWMRSMAPRRDTTTIRLISVEPTATSEAVVVRA